VRHIGVSELNTPLKKWDYLIYSKVPQSHKGVKDTLMVMGVETEEKGIET
jgi:hypothetical protein